MTNPIQFPGAAHVPVIGQPMTERPALPFGTLVQNAAIEA